MIFYDPAMRFDLTDLRLFLAVVDAGSITHGAAEAGLSLPAASERLRDMEIDGGVKLLERGRRGIATTEAGEALAHHARLILRQMAEMRGELDEHAKDPRKTIRILANTAALTEFLPERLAPFMAAHPRIDVDIKERQSLEIAKAVSSGLAEIGILSDAVETSGLFLRPFAIDRLVLVAPRDHPLAAHEEIAFARTVNQPFVGLTSGALKDHLDAQAARIGVRLKMRVRMRSFEAICGMVAAGVGVAIVPETAARRYARPGSTASLPLTDRWATRRLSTCVRAGDALPSAAQNLLDHLSP